MTTGPSGTPERRTPHPSRKKLLLGAVGTAVLLIIAVPSLHRVLTRAPAPPPAPERAAAPAVAPDQTKTDPRPTTQEVPPEPPADPLDFFRQEAQREARAGDLAAAIDKIDQGLAVAPGNGMLKREMSHLLTQRGFGDLEDREDERAEGFFKEALFYWSENLEAMRGMALTRYRGRDLDGSRTWLEAVIDRGGDRPDVYSLLGRISYEQNQLPEALDWLRLSLTLEPEQPEVVAQIEKIRREIKAEKGFGSLDTRHFQIRYEGREDAASARQVRDLLEDAYFDVGSEMGYYPELPVTVILYTDRQFSDVTRSPAWAGALFDGKIRIPARGLSAGSAELKILIRHEYTHALVHEASQGRAPVWLHEGLAQSMEGRATDSVGSARLVLQRGGPFPLAELEGEFIRFSPDRAEAAYLESRLAVEYLRAGWGRATCREILRQLGLGEDTATAVRRVVGVEYSIFSDQFASWVRDLAR